MDLDRRTFTLGSLVGLTAFNADADAAPARSGSMYGLITQFMTRPDQRDELIRILATGTKGMPGCLSYVIAEDAARDDAIWVTEVWTDAESHAASLRLPAVQEALAKGRPMIAGVGSRIATRPVAGA